MPIPTMNGTRMSGPRPETGLVSSEAITQADVDHARAQWRLDARGAMKKLLDARPTKSETA